MDIESINSDVKTAFLTILSINEKDQEKEISRLYDVDCRLENSYLILQGREGEWFRETREIVWLERKGKANCSCSCWQKSSRAMGRCREII